MLKIGIIGGSGLEDVAGIEYIGEISLETSYGKPSSPFKHFKSDNAEFFVLSRHGIKHELSPAHVNYRANVMGFKQLNVDAVYAFSSVGGINSALKAGSLVLLDNAVDYTAGRIRSLFTMIHQGVYHVDLTFPFCGDLRNSMSKAAKSIGVALVENGTYICTSGPRLETAAEIKLYDRWGMDVVGMTLFPEVTMFREAEICYCCVAVVANVAAGLSGDKLLKPEEIIAEGKKAMYSVSRLIAEVPRHITTCTCGCQNALDGAKM